MYIQPFINPRKPTPLQLTPVQTYLGEDENNYYYMDGFFDNLGNMFKRMVKITPKSFTPGNIYKGFINTTLTTVTGGAYQLLPKDLKRKVYEVGKVAVPVVAGGVLAATVAPSVMSMIGPKLSSVASSLGKPLSTVGQALFGVLQKLPAAKQAEVAQQVSSEQLKTMEQTGQIPAEVQALIDRAAQEAYSYALQQQNPPSIPATAYPAGYDPTGQAVPEREPVAQAGMMGGDMNTILLVGLAVGVGLLMSQKK